MLSITDGLTDAQKREIESLLVRVRLETGRALLEEGKAASGLYLVDGGRVAVLKRDMGGHEQLITQLLAPAVVGDLEVLTGEPCAASVRVTEPGEARLLPYDAFDRLLSRGDVGAVRLLRNLARALGSKLLATDEVYVDMAIWR